MPLTTVVRLGLGLAAFNYCGKDNVGMINSVRGELGTSLLALHDWLV